jgi:hypothetical protein
METDTKESFLISKTGLISLNEIEMEQIKDVQVYYDAGGRWYGPNKEGFAAWKDSQAATYLTFYGFSKTDKAGNVHGAKPVERALLWMTQNRKVAYAGPLAGYPAGVHQCGEDKILVTEGTKLVKPVKGNCDKICSLIESMLAEQTNSKPAQATVFYTLLAARYTTLLERLENPGTAIFRFCPALALVGPKGCGKSALIDLVLKPLLGGRAADPTSFLNEPKFNKDLFLTPLLVMDDKGSPPTLAIRRQRGENLKDLIWKEEQRMEGKGMDALPLRPVRWLIMACNTEDSALQILPTLTDSLSDKIVHLLCRQADWLPGTHAENDQWVKDLRAELPAFAHFLKTFKPPKTAKLDPRSRVIIFHHPAISEKLRGMQPEMKLLGLIDHYKLASAPEEGFWGGSATEFNERMIELDDDHGVYRGMFSTLNAVGRALMELSNVCPDRVQHKNHGNTSHYTIKP